MVVHIFVPLCGDKMKEALLDYFYLEVDGKSKNLANYLVTKKGKKCLN